MANPALDRLAAVPDTPSWQDDAEGADTNLPQDSDPSDETEPTGLAPQIRNLKSQVRAFSLDAAWANYTGLESAPSPEPPIKQADDMFRLTGDWSAATGNGVAVQGRAVRITMTDGTKVIANVFNTPTLSGGFTDVELDSPVITEDIEYVEWSALGSCLEAGPFPLVLNYLGTHFVVRTTQGGTGRDDASYAAGLEAVLSLASAVSDPDANTTKGTVALASANGTLAVKVKWATQRFTIPAAVYTAGDEGEFELTYNSAFASKVYALTAIYQAVSSAFDTGLVLQWRDVDAASRAGTALTSARIVWRMTQDVTLVADQDVDVSVLAIGL